MTPEFARVEKGKFGRDVMVGERSISYFADGFKPEMAQELCDFLNNQVSARGRGMREALANTLDALKSLYISDNDSNRISAKKAIKSAEKALGESV